MLSQLGEEARILAGGQSLIPLMKLRFANPEHLVDLSFVPETAYIRQENGALHFGAMTRHAQVESSDVAAKIPIVHDCAAGIADVQIRNRGTMGGSLAEADPSGDWATVLSTLQTDVVCAGPDGERTLPLQEFILDAYTTALAPAELVREVIVHMPAANSGGAYLAFKRSAPVYPTASAAAQVTMQGDVCEDAKISLGCVGLMAIRATQAEDAIRGQRITDEVLERVAEAVRSAAEPQTDMRGSAEYKRTLVAALAKRAVRVAERRARGEHVEVHHIYA